MPRIIPNLWFDTEALEAAEFYCSMFPNSEITRVAHYTEGGPGPAGTVVTVDFVLDGEAVHGINGGPQFTFTEAISLLDRLRRPGRGRPLLGGAVGGRRESMCGWLKDRYGLSWQVCPDEMGALMADPDPAAGQRAFRAMLSMTKIDIAAIRAAADDERSLQLDRNVTAPDLPAVDDLCRLVQVARRLRCHAHLIGTIRNCGRCSSWPAWRT